MHALPDALTLRQQFILSEMRQHSERQYRLARYKQRMQITYETSRTDLMKLAKKGMVKKHKEGKAFIYSVS
jgi:predicted transcriptional regulator